MANGDVAQERTGIEGGGLRLSASSVRALVPWLALGLWTLAEVAVAVVRPGELLELALMAVAGVAVWPLILDRRARPADIAIGATAFAAPLPRYVAGAELHGASRVQHAPLPLALLAPSSLLVLAAAALVLRERAGAARPPLLASAGAALLLLGGAIASAASAHPQAALADWWLISGHSTGVTECLLSATSRLRSALK